MFISVCHKLGMILDMKENRGSPQNRSGQSIVEYALILTLVAIVMLLSVTYLGQRTANTMENTMSSFGNEEADPGACGQ